MTSSTPQPLLVHDIFISPAHDFKGHYGKPRGDHGVERVEAVECVAGRGLRGDRYFDYKEDFKGQVSFFDQALYELVKTHFERPALGNHEFRRNVLVSGIDLYQLVGKRFRIGEVLFEGSEECAPCFWMNEAIGPGAEDFLRHRGGLRARIRQGGTLRVGPQPLVVLAA